MLKLMVCNFTHILSDMWAGIPIITIYRGYVASVIATNYKKITKVHARAFDTTDDFQNLCNTYRKAQCVHVT